MNLLPYHLKFFEINELFWHQVMGEAMGTPAAVVGSNLVVAFFTYSICISLQSTPSDSIIATRRSSQSFAGMSTDDDLQLSSGSVPTGGRNGRANMSGSSSVSAIKSISQDIKFYIISAL